MNRVAVAGNYFQISAFSEEYDLNNPEYATPLGIAISSGLNMINDSFRVILNGKPAKLFRSGSFTALNLLMMNGYSFRDIMGRSGQSIAVTVNGQRQVFYGTAASPASLGINGREGKLSEIIHAGDSIDFVPAESGKPAHAFLGDIEGAITCEEIRLNGMYAFLETPLKNGDVIEMKFSKEDKKEDEGEKIKASSDTENKERAENRKTNGENRQEKEEPYVSQIRETPVLETAAARRGKNTEKKEMPQEALAEKDERKAKELEANPRNEPKEALVQKAEMDREREPETGYRAEPERVVEFGQRTESGRVMEFDQRTEPEERMESGRTAELGQKTEPDTRIQEVWSLDERKYSEPQYQSYSPELVTEPEPAPAPESRLVKVSEATEQAPLIYETGTIQEPVFRSAPLSESKAAYGLGEMRQPEPKLERVLPPERRPEPERMLPPERRSEPERMLPPERRPEPERMLPPERRSEPERGLPPERRAEPERVLQPDSEQRSEPAPGPVRMLLFYLNGSPLRLPRKKDGQPYYLMDMIEYSGIDLKNPAGTVKLTVNGMMGMFQQELRERDAIEIRIEER